jgi:hypothetical protein
MEKSEIVRRLGYHPIHGNQKFLYESNRALFIRMAEFIAQLGDSRETSLALTALQESLMWTNAHIACNGIDVDEEFVEACNAEAA